MRQTFVYREGKLVKKRAVSVPAVQIMPDIAPYKSMITGELISGRAHHRTHLKHHGCIEVGNEK